MNSRELLEALSEAPKLKFSDIKTLEERQSGIYGWFEEGKLIYVGKAKNLKRRLVGDHVTGISSKSVFVNYLRMQRFLSITLEDIEKYPKLPRGVIESRKIQEYMNSCMEVITLVCNPEELLEDVKQKPEKFLFEYYKGELWNNPNKVARLANP